MGSIYLIGLLNLVTYLNKLVFSCFGFGISQNGNTFDCSFRWNLLERRAGNHLEGVPFYGPRSDISGPEISNKIAGSKRSNSDSTFMGSSRDGIPQMGPESLEGSQLMKV